MIIDKKRVRYNGKYYWVCKYMHNNEERLFVIDDDVLIQMQEEHGLDGWYQINHYIGYKITSGDTLTTCYLHNLVMGRPHGGGRGQEQTVDHISRNTLDNRRENLRLATQTRQNENQQRRTRTVELPEGCGISPNDIPKCVYYAAPNGKHGERFVLEIKGNGKRKIFKSTSSKKVSLKDKLIEIKQKILDIADTYPELIENKTIIENYTNQQIMLLRDFNRIILASGFDCAEDNVVPIPRREVLTADIDNASRGMQRYLNTTNTAVKRGRRHRNNLPPNCGVTPDMIPRYCYYRAATDKRGDAFIVDRHPLLPEGTRQWRTTESRAVTTRRKWQQLMAFLKELKNNKNEDNDEEEAEEESTEESTEEESEESAEEESSEEEVQRAPPKKLSRTNSKKQLKHVEEESEEEEEMVQRAPPKKLSRANSKKHVEEESEEEEDMVQKKAPPKKHKKTKSKMTSEERWRTRFDGVDSDESEEEEALRRPKKPQKKQGSKSSKSNRRDAEEI